jgi:hypothetical protein
MSGFGKTDKECKWTAKQLKAEITARNGIAPVNNRKKCCGDALYKLRVVQSAAEEDREAIEDGIKLPSSISCLSLHLICLPLTSSCSTSCLNLEKHLLY